MALKTVISICVEKIKAQGANLKAAKNTKFRNFAIIFVNRPLNEIGKQT